MEHRKRGIGRKGLKGWAFLFLTMWVLSKAMGRALAGNAETMGLEALLDSSPHMMVLSGAILILEALATCGVVLFSAMVLEGVRCTSGIQKYLARVGILALVSEIPYDLLMTGRPFAMEAQNPAFGLLVAVITVYYWNLFAGRGGKNLLIRLAVLGAALIWCSLLKVEYGLPLLICTLVLWLFREDPSRWGIGGMLAGGLCILISPFFLAAPMGAMILHFYHGEDCRSDWAYPAYPMLLLLGWILTALMG